MCLCVFLPAACSAGPLQASWSRSRGRRRGAAGAGQGHGHQPHPEHPREQGCQCGGPGQAVFTYGHRWAPLTRTAAVVWAAACGAAVRVFKGAASRRSRRGAGSSSAAALKARVWRGLRDGRGHHCLRIEVGGPALERLAVLLGLSNSSAGAGCPVWWQLLCVSACVCQRLCVPAPVCGLT